MSEPGAVPDLFAGLFDDAAIFPPGNAPMPEAVRSHRAHRRAWYTEAVGEFVCSSARFDELAAELDAADDYLDLVLTVPDALAAVQPAVAVATQSGRVRLRAVEVPLGDSRPDEVAATLGAFTELPLTGYVEVPPASVDAAVVKAIKAAGLRLKLRTGGTSATAFPTEAELADALVAAVAAGLAFKCTAGLHHAVRHRDPVTGFEHHGFLNGLLATHCALSGGDPASVAAVLADGDPASVAARIAALAPAEVGAVRASFASFGTCSIEDPVRDLLALGLLEGP